MGLREVNAYDCQAAIFPVYFRSRNKTWQVFIFMAAAPESGALNIA
jgi:hypothetical protein